MQSSNCTDVLSELKDAVQNVRTGLRKVLDIAPNRTLYQILLDSTKNPLLQSILSIPDESHLTQNDIIFAIELKEMYDTGRLEILEYLIKGDIEQIKTCNGNTKQETFENNSPNDSSSKFHEDNIPNYKEKLETCDGTEIFIEEVGKDKVRNSNSFESTPDNISSSNCRKDETRSAVDQRDAETEKEVNSNAKEPDSYISELFTSDVMRSEMYVPEELVYKRDRKWGLLKQEELPQAPSIEDPELLRKVFSHQSIVNYLNISPEFKVQLHNERLEFLGDALLQFITSMIIYERFPNFSEGQLSILRSTIVSNSSLLKWSQMYGFDKQLRKNLIDSSILAGNNKLYADVFEAYLGGIAEQYMMETSEGETNVNDFMKGWFEVKSWIEELSENHIRGFDPSIVFKMQYSKSSKQDLRLLLGQNNNPDYIRVNLSNKRILSCIKVNNKVYGYGIGTSNKEADARAAVDAISNPEIRKICPEDIWDRFESNVGLNEKGGLKLRQYPTKVTSHELQILKKEIAIKFKNGDIKLLASENNPNSLLITNQDRMEVAEKRDSILSIDNTEGESDTSQIEESKEVFEHSRNRPTLADDCMEQKKRVKEKVSARQKKVKQRKPQIEMVKEQEIKNFKESTQYYSKEYTLGRGGVFGSESAKVRKGKQKKRRGICRNAAFEVVDNDNNDGRSDTFIIECHEVYESCDEIDVESKNRIYAAYDRRGSNPNFRIYRTTNDEYLSELWFGSLQIVSYGLDKNKKKASQKAAMLACKREDYYGLDDSNENDP